MVHRSDLSGLFHKNHSPSHPPTDGLAGVGKNCGRELEGVVGGSWEGCGRELEGVVGGSWEELWEGVGRSCGRELEGVVRGSWKEL